MTPKEILVKARALIDSPEKWTQGCFSRNEKNEVTWYSNPEACKFCAMGAVYKSNSEYASGFDENGLTPISSVEAIDLLLKHGAGSSVAYWNDVPHRKHAEVLAVFDKAIASLT